MCKNPITEITIFHDFLRREGSNSINLFQLGNILKKLKTTTKFLDAFMFTLKSELVHTNVQVINPTDLILYAYADEKFCRSIHLFLHRW